MAKAFYNGNNTIPAIETEYKGYLFRSRLEAKWAVVFDHLGIRWQYETERYKAGEKTYLPDFYLPEQNTYVEIKPLKGDRGYARNIYLAGKVSRTDWRHEMVPGLREAKWSDHIHLSNGWDYTGPFFTSCDHGCAHAYGVHGMESECSGTHPRGSSKLVDLCLQGVGDSDVLFAWLDSKEAYGTLVEIGYAHGNGREVWVAMSNKLKEELVGAMPQPSYHGEIPARAHDLWFVMSMAYKCGYFDSPQEALDTWLPKDDADLIPMKEFWKTNGADCLLIRGTPDPNGVDYETFRFARTWGPSPRRIYGGISLFPGQGESKERLVWVKHGEHYPATRGRVNDAMLAGRQARFEYGERG